LGLQMRRQVEQANVTGARNWLLEPKRILQQVANWTVCIWVAFQTAVHLFRTHQISAPNDRAESKPRRVKLYARVLPHKILQGSLISRARDRKLSAMRC